MAVEKIRISHKEYLSGKWSRVSQGSELRNPRDGSSSQTYYEATVIRKSDGSIDESSYSQNYRNQLHKNDKKKEKKSKDKEKEGCLKKIILFPFRLIWWVVKMVLVIVSLGTLSDVLNGDS